MQIFDQFSIKISERAGVKLKNNLSETWKENNLPDRPGSLSEELRLILFQYYRQVKSEILKMVTEIQKTSPEIFESVYFPYWVLKR